MCGNTDLQTSFRQIILIDKDNMFLSCSFHRESKRLRPQTLPGFLKPARVPDASYTLAALQQRFRYYEFINSFAGKNVISGDILQYRNANNKTALGRVYLIFRDYLDNTPSH